MQLKKTILISFPIIHKHILAFVQGNHSLTFLNRKNCFDELRDEFPKVHTPFLGIFISFSGEKGTRKTTLINRKRFSMVIPFCFRKLLHWHDIISLHFFSFNLNKNLNQIDSLVKSVIKVCSIVFFKKPDGTFEARKKIGKTVEKICNFY